MTWDPAKHPRGAGGLFGNTVGALHLKKHSVGAKDLIEVISSKVKKYAGFATVEDFITAHPKGKAAALRVLAADHKAGRIAFKAAHAGSAMDDHAIEVLSKSTKKYAGHATVGSFVNSHPKGPKHAMKVLAADQKAGRIAIKKGVGPTAAAPAAPTPAPKAAGTSDKPIDASKWKKIGEKKGSNPGGTYQAPDGKKFYLKEAKSKEHLENELLANKLYQKLGVETLGPKAYKLADGKLAVGSEIAPLTKFDSNDAAHIALAQKDFAAHAYLANWDAVGQTYDNLGLKGGKLAQLDAGGALKFRAQGAVKTAFGEKVDEFDSLRSSKNLQAEKVFGGMTTAQLEASAKPVLKLSDKDIDEAVAGSISDPKQRADYAKILKARRDDLGKRVEAEKAKDKAAAEVAKTLHPDDAKRWSKAAGIKTFTPRHLSVLQRSQLVDEYHASGINMVKAEKNSAVRAYVGSGYHEINDSLRKGWVPSSTTQAHIQELDKQIAASSFKRDTVMYRGYGWNADLQKKLPPPPDFDDLGFSSISFNPGVSKDFTQGEKRGLYRVRVPKGFPGMAVMRKSITNEDGFAGDEAEVLLPRGTTFKVIKRANQAAYGVYDVVDVEPVLPKGWAASKFSA